MLEGIRIGMEQATFCGIEIRIEAHGTCPSLISTWTECQII